MLVITCIAQSQMFPAYAIKTWNMCVLCMDVRGTIGPVRELQEKAKRKTSGLASRHAWHVPLFCRCVEEPMPYWKLDGSLMFRSGTSPIHAFRACTWLKPVKAPKALDNPHSHAVRSAPLHCSFADMRYDEIYVWAIFAACISWDFLGVIVGSWGCNLEAVPVGVD